MNRVVPLKPSCIPYTPNQKLDNGAQLVVSSDFDELRDFWSQNQHHFAYAARGKPAYGRRLFLQANEWIFAPTKIKLIEAVVRWEAIGIHVQRVKWSDLACDARDGYCRELELIREVGLAVGSWGESEERDYRSRLANSDGFWRLVLPACLQSIEWFYHQSYEIHHPRITAEQAHQIFKLRTFLDWHLSGNDEVDIMDQYELDTLFEVKQEEVLPTVAVNDENLNLKSFAVQDRLNHYFEPELL